MLAEWGAPRVSPADLQDDERSYCRSNHPDGILLPRPISGGDNWEPMTDVREKKALYYALCKFNEVNRTAADRIRDYETLRDPARYCFLTLYIFLDVCSNFCAATARKLSQLFRERPSDLTELVAKMKRVAGGGPGAMHERVSLEQFLCILELWNAAVGIPRDVHAAFADFDPRTCNIFRLRQCAVMEEYERHLRSLGGELCGLGGLQHSCLSLPERSPRGEPAHHALLFGAEGAQKVGMLKDVAGKIPRVQEMLRHASERLGFDVLQLCLDGPASKLDSVRYGGVLMYLVGWAAYEKLRHEQPEVARRVRAVAGENAGELVALTVAGALPFRAGLELVIARGEAMEEALSHCPDYAGCLVVGLSEEKVKSCCQLALEQAKGGGDGAGTLCQISAEMFRLGFVLCGNLPVLREFEKCAKAEKVLRVQTTPNVKPNHSPVMKKVQWVIESKLREFRQQFRAPWCDVYFSVSSEYVMRAPRGTDTCEGEDEKTGVDKLELLYLNTVALLCAACWVPFRWSAVVEAMVRDNVSEFWECSCGEQNKALMKRLSKDLFEKTSTCVV